jgi:hypothetical protein
MSLIIAAYNGGPGHPLVTYMKEVNKWRTSYEIENHMGTLSRF